MAAQGFADGEDNATGLARQAWERAQAAQRVDDPGEARRWLERAHRLAPQDDAVALAFAVTLLRVGDAVAALTLLESIVERTDVREAWLALTAARRVRGDARGAAAALQHVLSRHALPLDAEITALASNVVSDIGAAGWCGLRADGSLLAEARGMRVRAVTRAGLRHVTAGGRALLGSPIELPRLTRLEGIVAPRDGGIEGWAWHPADPDTDPVLTIRGARGRGRLCIVATDTDITAQGTLARPRRFRLEAEALAGLSAPIAVRDRAGVHLPGSPLDPWGESRGAAAIALAVARRYPARGRAKPTPLALAAAPVGPRGAAAHAPLAPDRPVAVVVPVHSGAALTLDCLERVAATAPAGTDIIVVDDATPEPDLASGLDALAAAGRIHLLRHAANRGFPASANAGLRAAMLLRGQPDIVLLNSDTRPAPGWLARLRAAVHAAPDIGTATPLSNDATILSYPRPSQPNPPPPAAMLARLAAATARAGAGAGIDIPTAVGFCMYIRRECLARVGLFRDDVFAQGYGEENDFCVRAHQLGWRHVAAADAYVAHLSGQSFGAATGPLFARNLAVLERLHPGYADLVQAFQARDPLASVRRRLDAARWRAARARTAAPGVVLVTHDQGGGVERVVRARAQAVTASGGRAIVLRPARPQVAGQTVAEGAVLVSDGALDPDDFPNLRFVIPHELAGLAALLRGDNVARLEVHHLLGHHHALPELAARLGIAVVHHVHDYASFCPRISLLGPQRRYCGEPADPAECEACVSDAGSALRAPIGVAALRARSAAAFASAAEVIVPSRDTAARLRRHFPALAPKVAPLEDDTAPVPRARPNRQGPLRVAVIGAIGAEKGYDVVLACARDAAARALNLEFVIVGHTSDDARLLDTGRVFVTGRYDEAEALTLIRAQQAHLAFLPSVWPETWCFALGVAWQAGLNALVFDIGAQAERVRATGRGWVVPLGLQPSAINTALISVRPATGDV